VTLAYTAMMMARKAHAQQVRKYTGNPYADHLAEVAGIVATVAEGSEVMIATAWLHDYIEDCRGEQSASSMEVEIWNGLASAECPLWMRNDVAHGVYMLSDLETGNRAERKAASCVRLAQAPGWVQTIKCADLISNTSSIVKHDPKFAVTYLAEKRALLDVLTKADPRLLALAREQATKE
jgi:guanosine-3',5'-bis(diphosphate) 3'-pyrophosphohydrolase